jgi:hypothetical protein
VKNLSDSGTGHAFPHMYLEGSIISLAGGLTKRELFAAMAMQGMLAFGFSTVTGDGIARERFWQDPIAPDAVKQADALLAELAKGGE